MNILDLFSGGGGSHSQGEPTTTGAGDGSKGDQITKALNFITGAYNTITGQGSIGGPAPSTKSTDAKKTNVAIYIVGGVVAVIVLWLVLKKK